MVNFSKTKRIHLIIIFLYLVLFPFGQLIRLDIYSSFGRFAVYFTDILVLISAGLFLVSKKRVLHSSFGSILSFILICVFSLIFSLTVFKPIQIIIGVLYFVRITSYLVFFLAIWNLVKDRLNLKKLILRSLILVGVAVAVFGWIQYFLFPDLRGLVVFGWDDHYFRLVSTFLDPAFTGIIIVFTFLAVLAIIQKRFSLLKIVSLIFLLVTLGFTYSRSSYLALILGVLFFVLNSSRKKIAILLIIGLVALLPILPRPAGEGVKLERIYSIFQKLVDYKQGVALVEKSPVFGLGFNNICLGRKIFLNERNLVSHSCNGLDNSFLFILATTGVVGFLLFLKMIHDFIKTTSNDIYGRAFLASGVALLIHTMFTNTLFYPWVVGWIVLLGAVSRVKE